MISKFWDELFRLGDEYRETYGGDSVQYQVLTDIKNVLQDVYDTGNECAENVTDFLNDESNRDKGRGIISQLSGLHAFNDKQDGREYYEIDGMLHFDTIAEVLEYIIEDRNRHYKRIKTDTVTAMITALTKERDEKIKQESHRIQTIYSQRIDRIGMRFEEVLNEQKRQENA